MQAAVLRAQLPHLDAWNGRRREIARVYMGSLVDSAVRLPQTGDDSVAHLYVIRSAERERIRAALSASGIASDVHYPIPDHLQESLRKVPFRRTALPVTEACARGILTLPCFPEMTEEEVGEVARVVASV